MQTKKIKLSEMKPGDYGILDDPTNDICPIMVQLRTGGKMYDCDNDLFLAFASEDIDFNYPEIIVDCDNVSI